MLKYYRIITQVETNQKSIPGLTTFVMCHVIKKYIKLEYSNINNETTFRFIFSGKSETQLASHVLQFLYVSDCGFRFPVAQFPSHDCTASDLFLLFWKGVGMMREYGFK